MSFYTFFYMLFCSVIFQRVVELIIARQHENRLKGNGAYEVGGHHYRWMVIGHALFFVSLFLEVILLKRQPAEWWWAPFSLFILAQIVRIWAIHSLGDFWNTKIIILPGAEVIVSGPYKYLRHPNYLTVIIEFIMVPLIFQAYITMICFTLFNGWLLYIRIPIEEKALSKLTNYDKQFQSKDRFLPKPIKEG